MAKNFRIEAFGYGGELVIGRCNPAFVAHWAPIVQDEGDGDLIELIFNMDEFDDAPEDALVDPEGDIMPFVEDPKAWHDFDDVEHLSGVFSDSSFRVVEVDDDGNEVEGGFEQEYCLSDFRTLACREAYHQDIPESPEPDNENYIPVLSCFSSEKGSFWTATFTAESFQPELLAFTVLETSLAELVESVFYNFEELEMDHDMYSTSGKGMYASVGWMNSDWHDASISESYLSDAMEEWKYDLEEETNS